MSATLAEKFNGPTSAFKRRCRAAATTRRADRSHFNTLQENQRAALLLEKGHVIIGWSSHCDTDPWHGWVMSYNASSSRAGGVFNTSPNGSRNGVWMSGGGAAADANGNIYFATGNGTWNGTTDYGDSIVKLGTAREGQFPGGRLLHPYNQATLADDDTDLAAGGLVLLPALSSGSAIARATGQTGHDLSARTSITSASIASISRPPAPTAIPMSCRRFRCEPRNLGIPAYWNGNLYWTGANDSIKAYSFNANNSGLLSTANPPHRARRFSPSRHPPRPSPRTATPTEFFGRWTAVRMTRPATAAAPVAWGSTPTMPPILRNLLYTSSQAANNRDSPGIAVKFEKPIIANGKVYVGTQSSVTVYGLLVSALPAASTPTLSPAPGTYSSAQSITLSDSDTGSCDLLHDQRHATHGELGAIQRAAASEFHGDNSSRRRSERLFQKPSGWRDYFITLPATVNLSAVDNVAAIAEKGTAQAAAALTATETRTPPMRSERRSRGKDRHSRPVQPDRSMRSATQRSLCPPETTPRSI